MIKAIGATITPCYENLVALDIDVSPFDNSKTKKEGVSRTYKGFGRYAPIFAYLGQEGYCVNVELRAGKTHCQNGTVEFLKQSILYAKNITDAPILVRMDAGNDTVENIRVCREEETGQNWVKKKQPNRLPAHYRRLHGVKHLLAAYDLKKDKLYGHIKNRKRRKEVLVEFLKYLRSLYP